MKCNFTAEIKTGNIGGAGTDEGVTLKLIQLNPDGNIGKELHWSLNVNRHQMETNATDKFYMEADYFGPIDLLHVEIEPRGKDGHATAWNVEYIKILQNYGNESQSLIFPINIWLGAKGRDPAQAGVYGAIRANTRGIVNKYQKVLTDDLNLTYGLVEVK